MPKPIKQQDFYHLQHTPFSHHVASQAPFVGPGQQHVINTIQQSIGSGHRLLSLCGKAGLGKTTLIQIVLAQLASQSLTPIYIEAANLDAETLASRIAPSLGLATPQTQSPVTFDTLLAQVAQNKFSAQPILLVIDDAHTLSVDTLKELGLFVIQSPLSIQAMLVGEPMLADAYQQAGLQEQVRPFELSPLTLAESAAYIQHHIHYATAGQYSTLFSRGAINTIARHADGIPQTLNVICAEVLGQGFGELENPISATTARQVITEFPGLKLRRRLPLKWVAAIAACALITCGAFAIPHLLPTHLKSVVLAVLPTGPQPTPSPLPKPLTAVDTIQPETSHVKSSSQPTQANVDASAPSAVTPSPADAVQTKQFTAEKPATAPQSELTTLDTTQTDTQLPASVLAPSDPLTRIETALLDVLPNGGKFSLAIQAIRDQGALYQEGETLGFHVQADADVYLRIDYVQANEQVVQLLPQPLVSNQAKAGKPFTLGTATSQLPLVIGPPFGEEMLVVIASRQPFPLQTGVLSATSGDHYAAQIAQSLATLKTRGDVAVTTLRLRTQTRAKEKWSRVARP